MYPSLQAVKDLLSNAKSIVVFTGAGVSVESGLPTYSDTNGLWQLHNPDEVASCEAFSQDPYKVWDWHGKLLDAMRQATPNPAHLAIAAMESSFDQVTVITQNIDGLHQRAGSSNVIELHGNIFSLKGFCDIRQANEIANLDDLPPSCPVCMGCNKPEFEWDLTATREGLSPLERAPSRIPRCPCCNGLLRPDIVWFGEALNPRILDAAWQAADQCDALITVGASLQVSPARDLPFRAKRLKKIVIEVNTSETEFTHKADLSFRNAASYLNQII